MKLLRTYIKQKKALKMHLKETGHVDWLKQNISFFNGNQTLFEKTTKGPIWFAWTDRNHMFQVPTFHSLTPRNSILHDSLEPSALRHQEQAKIQVCMFITSHIFLVYLRETVKIDLLFQEWYLCKSINTYAVVTHI